MRLSDEYVEVEPVEKEVKEGYQPVEVQDNFTYKGKVTVLPTRPVYMGNEPLEIGDVILFAKYSPDTHDIGEDNKKVKLVMVKNILKVL